jgi:plasmid stabilization system protein ParE
VRVLFTPAARAQFLDAFAYIRAESASAAQGMLERSNAALRQLGEFPESGHPLPEFPDFPHREVLVDPYRFFYRIAGGAVWVVGVWHCRQLPDDPEQPAHG